MISFIVTGHGKFAEGLFNSVELIMGEIAQAEVISFEEDVEDLTNKVTDAIESLDSGDGVICFTDLAGGTPFNVCSKLATGKENVRVIGGTNSPMLLTGLMQREMDIDTAVQQVIHEGKDAIKAFQMNKSSYSESSDGL